jgi:hypothetical protein
VAAAGEDRYLSEEVARRERVGVARDIHTSARRRELRMRARGVVDGGASMDFEGPDWL